MLFHRYLQLYPEAYFTWSSRTSSVLDLPWAFSTLDLLDSFSLVLASRLNRNCVNDGQKFPSKCFVYLLWFNTWTQSTILDSLS